MFARLVMSLRGESRSSGAHGVLGRASARLAFSLLAGALGLAPAPRAAFAHLMIIRQGPESAATLEDGDRTGAALAAGDFDGDGFEDLAIGAPNDEVGGLADAGAVIVVYGSRLGLTDAGAGYRTAGTLGQVDQAGAQFGYALGSGDFNADGYDDLAIGAPYYDVGAVADCGRIYIVLGSNGGLGSAAATYTQATFTGSNEADDHFGWSFAVANFNGDLHANGRPHEDLAIGGPGEDNGAGAVFWIHGGGAGLNPAEVGFFKQGSFGVTARAGDHFGYTLAAGNIFSSAFPDLVVGAPDRDGEDLIPTENIGRIYLIAGSAGGLTTSDHVDYWANVVDEAQEGARFGAALAFGTFTGDTGPIDYGGLAIGEPGRDVSGVTNAGRVLAVRGAALGLNTDAATQKILTQNVSGSSMEPGDQFGFSLAAGDENLDGDDDLVVGTPYEDAGSTLDVGAVQVFDGYPGGWLSTSGVATYTQGTVNDRSEANDHFGWSVVFGRFEGIYDLATVAAGTPDENTSDDISYSEAGNDAEEFTDAGQVTVIAYWRQAHGLSCRNALVTDCEGQKIFSLRPYDRVRVASTTKVMSLLVTAERIQLPPGNTNYADSSAFAPIPDWVRDDDKVTGSRFNFNSDDLYRLSDIMRIVTCFSANDATYVMANAATGGANAWEGKDSDTCSEFVAAMNVRAGQLGMSSTSFQNPPGRPWGDGYSTPEDMEKLMRAAVANALVVQLLGTTTQTVRRGDAGMCGETKTDLGFGWNSSLNNALGTPNNAIKPGSNDPSQQCTVFATSTGAAGWVVGTAFGWRRASPATPSSVMFADMAALLNLGVGDCGFGGAASPVASNPPDDAERDADEGELLGAPPGPPLLTLANLSTESCATPGGATQIEPAEDDSLQIDVVRQSGTGAASTVLEVRQTSDLTLAPGESVSLGIAPFQDHSDIWIVNDGPVATDLQLSTNLPPTSGAVTLPPDAALLIPPYAGPLAPRFDLTIRNIASAAHAQLDVQVRGYFYPLSLAPPGTSGSEFSAIVRSGGSHGEAGLVMIEHGQDANPGSQVFISLHSPGWTVDVPSAGPVAGPGEFRSLGCWPNPARGAARLAIQLSRPAEVGVEIFDVQGRVRRRIAPRLFEAGSRALAWDGADDAGRPLDAGLYLLRWTAEGRRAAWGKLVIRR